MTFVQRKHRKRGSTKLTFKQGINFISMALLPVQDKYYAEEKNLLTQTKMLVRGMLVTSLPQVCASLLQSKHDCISKCLWLRMRA